MVFISTGKFLPLLTERLSSERSIYYSKIFNKENSQREFYTMPDNSIMNDSIKFAEWCYKTPPTCKDGNAIQCVSNLHKHY